MKTSFFIYAILIFGFLNFNVHAQCIIDTLKFNEMNQRISSLDNSSIQKLNVQYQSGNLPDIDWKTNPISACITKNHVMQIITNFIKLKYSSTSNFNIEYFCTQIDNMLDSVNYSIEMNYPDISEKNTIFSCLIRSSSNIVNITNYNLIQPKLILNNSIDTINLQNGSWENISSLFKNFDTTSRYNCSYTLYIEDTIQNGLSRKNNEIIFYNLSNIQSQKILNYYLQFSKNQKFLQLQDTAKVKIQKMLAENKFHLAINYIIELNKTIEIQCTLFNATHKLDLSFYRPLNENGERIK